MWHFEFEAPVGTRILSSRFIGVTGIAWSDMWWSHTHKKWLTIKECEECNGDCSTIKYVRSFKAFKRHLRKHPELQAYSEVVLVSRYAGYNIRAFWRTEGEE